jgi:hypothetical protein
MKIAFFGYAWGPGGRLDGYMQEMVEAYLGLGFEVDLFLGNYFSADGTVIGFKDDVDLARLAAYVREQAYVAAVSINNSLLLPQIVEAMEGRVVSVIVDGFNHLFRYDPQDRYAAFRLDAHFACIGSQFERELLARVPEIAGRVSLLSPATNGMLFPRETIAPAYPISWVAGLPTDAAAEAFMTRAMDDPAAYGIAAGCLRAIEGTGDLAAMMADHAEVIEGLAAEASMPFRAFEMMLQDMVTTRQRVEVADRLAPHGLALFGNPAWARAMVLSQGAFAAFTPGPPARSHDDLLRIYNASLISVNLPQSFISESFQYRLLDVMSSNALLVTKRTPDPDLHRVFGSDCPVPMYDSLSELESICAHYLAHEEERREIVAACNALVTPDFSFRSRGLDYLRLAGVAYRPQDHAAVVPREVRLHIDEGFLLT